jgi:hypothetical protein
VGHGDPELSGPRGERQRREREMVRIHAVLAGVIVLILFQFLLLMVAVDGALGAGGSRIFPTAAASVLCFAGSCWLIGMLAARRPGAPR